MARAAFEQATACFNAISRFGGWHYAGVPPFGYDYLSPGPPLLAIRSLRLRQGSTTANGFRPFPPHDVSRSNPDTSVNWANFAPFQRTVLLLPQSHALYQQLHALSPATDRLQGIVDDELRGQPGTSHLRRNSVNPGVFRFVPQLPGCGLWGRCDIYHRRRSTIHRTRRTKQHRNTRRDSPN